MLNSIHLASLPNSAARARLGWSEEIDQNVGRKLVATGDEVVVGTSLPNQPAQLQRFKNGTGESVTVECQCPGQLEGRVGGTVILRSPEGQLIGVSADTGERKWDYQAGGYPSTAFANEKMFVLDRQSLTGVTNKPDGELELSSPTNLSQPRTLTGDGAGGLVVQSGQYTGEGRLSRVDSEGNLLWTNQVDVGGPQHSPAVGPDQVAYATGFGGRYVALDLSSGEKIWELKTRETYVNAPTPGTRPGELVVSTHGGEVSSVDGQTGQVKWTVRAGGGVDQTFIHPDGTVFAHTFDRQDGYSLVALNPEHGDVDQRMPLPEGELVQGGDGNLYMVDRQLGRLQQVVLE